MYRLYIETYGRNNLHILLLLYFSVCAKHGFGINFNFKSILNWPCAVLSSRFKFNLIN